MPRPTIAAEQAASTPSVVWLSSWPARQAGTPRASIVRLLSMPIVACVIAGMCAPSCARTLLSRRAEIGTRFDSGSAFGLIEALKLVLTPPTST